MAGLSTLSVVSLGDFLVNRLSPWSGLIRAKEQIIFHGLGILLYSPHHHLVEIVHLLLSSVILDLFLFDLLSLIGLWHETAALNPLPLLLLKLPHPLSDLVLSSSYQSLKVRLPLRRQAALAIVL